MRHIQKFSEFLHPPKALTLASEEHHLNKLFVKQHHVKFPSTRRSATPHLQKRGGCTADSTRGEVQVFQPQKLKPPAAAYLTCNWLLRLSRLPVPKVILAQSSTTCSNLAWAVFNYTWYRRYNWEWSHTRKGDGGWGAEWEQQGEKSFWLEQHVCCRGHCSWEHQLAFGETLRPMWSWEIETVAHEFICSVHPF